MDDSYVCKKCDKPIDDIATAMVTGCECGCRVFRQAKSLPPAKTSAGGSPTSQRENDQISITVKSSGVYDVNIKTLFQRDSKDEPIFVQDPSGRINVILNPDA